MPASQASDSMSPSISLALHLVNRPEPGNLQCRLNLLGSNKITVKTKKNKQTERSYGLFLPKDLKKGSRNRRKQTFTHREKHRGEYVNVDEVNSNT